jgi:hypothetical protein
VNDRAGLTPATRELNRRVLAHGAPGGHGPI